MAIMPEFYGDRERSKESEIDDWFAKSHDVYEADDEMQTWGIDRILVGQRGGLPYATSVEYKTDWRAVDTGNLFVETQLRERDGEFSPGWLRTTIAQTIVFYLPQVKRLIMVDAWELKAWIFTYGKDYRYSPWVENEGGYAGRGVLFPIATGRKNLGSWIDIDMETGKVWV